MKLRAFIAETTRAHSHKEKEDSTAKKLVRNALQRVQESLRVQRTYDTNLANFERNKARGERERSPPLPQIMQSSFPHLGKSQGSAHPECNG